jgi:hypothetical protein
MKNAINNMMSELDAQAEGLHWFDQSLPSSLLI